MVKEKELKKLKLNQLIIDTQASFVNNQHSIKMNHTVRHSNTVYKPRGLLANDQNEAHRGSEVGANLNKSQDDDQAAAAGAAPGAPHDGALPDNDGNNVDHLLPLSSNP